MAQTLLTPGEQYRPLTRYIQSKLGRNLFLVCGHSFSSTRVGRFLEEWTRQNGVELVQFSDVQANPDYESVLRGTERFQAAEYTAIIGAGGGSAMDTAKCIRQFSSAAVPLLAIPTTAGSGSEATRFAVLYRQGIKESVNCALPDAVLLDPSTLNSLPLYQRKATLLDALCHGIESYWSLGSTPESRDFAGQAIRTIVGCYPGYLNNTPEGNAGMLEGAHLAGRAINVAKTTAGHAMCYQMTKRFGLAHGHAAALCVAKLWPFLLDHSERCADPRGRVHLERILDEIARCMGGSAPRSGAERFQAILDELELEVPLPSAEDLAALSNAVNVERLQNFPIRLSKGEIEALYQEIL